MSSMTSASTITHLPAQICFIESPNYPNTVSMLAMIPSLMTELKR